MFIVYIVRLITSPSKDIQGHRDDCVQVIKLDIRPQAKYALRLVIVDGHIDYITQEFVLVYMG